MKKVKLNLLVLALLIFCTNLGGETLNIVSKAPQGVNNTAILLIHGWPGNGDDKERGLDETDSPWGDLPDIIEEYLE